MTIEADLLDGVSALLGRRDMTQREQQDWLAGAIDGGPSGDGLFPLTDSTGFVRLLPAPSKLIDELSRPPEDGLPGGAASLSRYLADSGLDNTQEGLRAALDAFMLDDQVNTLIFDDGVYSPHWDGLIPNGRRKRLVGGEGAVLRATERSPSIRCVADAVWIESITGIEYQIGVDLSEDPTIVTSNSVSVLSLGLPRPLRKGQRVKIYANDQIQGGKSDAAGSRREGEFAIVGRDNDDDSTKVTLSAPLRARYTLNPRIALMPEAALSISGFTISCEPALIGAPGVGLIGAIQLIQMDQALLEDIRCVRHFGPVIWTVSCFQTVVRRPNIRRAVNVPSVTQFGYGVNMSCGEGDIVANGVFIDVRHPQDAGGYSCPVDAPEPWKYGVVRNGQTLNCVSLGCQNGFGVHDEVDGWLFQGNIAANHYQGASSGGAGFAIRGRNIKMRGNMDFNCRYGIGWSGFGPGGEVTDHFSYGARMGGLSMQIGTSDIAQDPELTLRDSMFRIRPDNIISAPLLSEGKDGATARLTLGDNVTFAIEGPIDPRRVLDLTQTVLRGRGPTIDLTRVEQPQDAIRSAGVAEGGSQYAVGDVLTIVGGTRTQPATFTVASVDQFGAVRRVDPLDAGVYTALPQGLVSATGGSGSGLRLTVSGGTGVNVLWQAQYDDTLVKFDRGFGMRIVAGTTFLNNLWSGAVDGQNSPFTSAHEFPDTSYEGFHDLNGSYPANPSGLYSVRFPGLRHSLRKTIRGKTTGTYYLEMGIVAGITLPVENLMDRRTVIRMLGANYDGITLPIVDKAKLPADFELCLVNSTAGRVSYEGIVMPAGGESVTLRYASTGAKLVLAKTWSAPTRIPNVRTTNYTTGNFHLGGLQQVRMVDGNRSITLPRGTLATYDAQGNQLTSAINARPGDRIVFEQRNANNWLFAVEAGGALVNPEGGPPDFTRSGGSGTSCYAEVLANADGQSAQWTIGGTVSP